MPNLPPERAAFADLLEPQLTPVRDAYNYCLLMAEAARTRLTETILDENGKSPLTASAFQELHLIFATVTGRYGLGSASPLPQI